MADHATDKAEPLVAPASGTNHNQASTEPPVSHTGTPEHQAAAPKEDAGTSINRAGSAKKQTRTPAVFSAATEDNIREMMNNARKVLQENGNSTKAGGDFADMALLATNLVQLMNASFIATDTIVRAVAYMRGDSQLSARSAIFQARRDRRAQKEAEQPLSEVKNRPLTNAAPGVVRAGRDSTLSHANSTSNNTKVSTDLGPTQGNAAPVSEDQQQKPQSLQTNPIKKKNRRNWNNRRSMRKLKNSVHPEVQENKMSVTASTVNEVKESKDVVDKKAATGEHKPETSGSETAVERDGAVVTVKA
ncbi:hypothetical protein AYO21_11162 [Fonsecaea monophora]|uniref:Uncharacterized protein n=1 Tax=Fonsecaea monophora TaxID=254056 RepID=A0A177ERQ5_9EURO|nr:hypothetical protein AYO21_11162 [Fonsecaea monophora]OAG34683.1 hypothetical protein AYO21_11162 [Fonsecaea monophora]